MQVRRSSAVQPHWPGSSRLVLWLAVGLFVFQVALHASTPASLNMAEWLSQVIGDPVVEHSAHARAGDMAGMPGMPDMQPHAPGHPGGSGHAHHAEGLCCMPPVALLPVLWAPPPSPLGRRTLVPPKAVREALMLLRATARGPPLAHAFHLRAV